MSEGSQTRGTETSIVVVAISSTAHIRRCLGAIQSQTSREESEVIVAADPRLHGIDDLRVDFPDVTFLTDPAADTPLTLAAMGLENARGDRLVLTEDSCIASPDWIAQLSSADFRTHAAIGGAVEVDDSVSTAMWAFAYVDFFRYMRPLRPGDTRSLSVCNVAYSSAHLGAIRDQWIHGFHETNVHDALETRFGNLFLNPDAWVQVSRNVTLGGAIYERYAFGRLFGATRVRGFSDLRRLGIVMLSLGLPFLLIGRLAAKALSDRRILARFAKALPAVLVFVLAWSWGEWLGYITQSMPRHTAAARDISTSGNVS